MNSRGTLSLPVVVLALLSGCASTSTTSYRDPAFASATFHKVAVLASGMQLAERGELEGRLAGALQQKHVDAAPVIKLVPPTRQLGEEELGDMLRGQGFDALLVVQRLEAGAKLEPSWSTILGGSSANDTSERLYAAFDASLVDLASNQVAWIASSRTGGSEYASTSDLLDSFASRTADELAEKQLLGR
jgi:hypothetical protein